MYARTWAMCRSTREAAHFRPVSPRGWGTSSSTGGGYPKGPCRKHYSDGKTWIPLSAGATGRWATGSGNGAPGALLVPESLTQRAAC